MYCHWIVRCKDISSAEEIHDFESCVSVIDDKRKVLEFRHDHYIGKLQKYKRKLKNKKMVVNSDSLT